MSADAPPSPAQAPPLVVRRKGDRSKIYIAVGVVVVAAIIVGVGAGTSWYGLRPASSSAGCPSAITLQGQGAAFPSSIVQQWAAEFGGVSSNPVNYVPTSAGQGITELTNLEVDFAVTDEGLNSTQTTALQAAVGPFLTLPVTGGAVTVIYDIPGLSSSHPLNLTGSELAAIYLGDITSWNNATLVANNPALKSISLTITSVHRADAAGMSYVMTNFMSDWNKTWRTNPSLGTSILPDWPIFTGADPATGNSAMISAVKSPPSGTGTVGYTDLYDAQQKSVSMASIENSYGANIAPTVAATVSAINDVYNATKATLPLPTGDWSTVSWVNASGATDYPLATLVYMLAPVNITKSQHTDTSAAAAALRWWINWVVTDGQYYSRTSFPFPSPPAPLLREDLNATALMTFDGGSFPSCM